MRTYARLRFLDGSGGKAAEGDYVGGATPGPEHAAAVVAVVVNHGGGPDLLGLKAYAVGAAGSQADLDGEDRGVCDGRHRHCGPCDSLFGDDLVGSEVVATGT